jgi:hypothetical protein
MLIGIDRVIIPIDEDEREDLSRRLVDAGLVYTGDTGLSDHPTADAHFALEGGGFIELVWEREPGTSPFRDLFDAMPRVAGLGFTSNDFDADRQRFAGEGTAWLWERSAEDEGGASRSAGPATVGEEDPYLFLIDGQRLPYADAGATGRLTEIMIEGISAPERRRRYVESLAVTFQDDQFIVGGTTVRFRQDDGMPIANSLTIDGARIDDELRLARGAMSFKR